MADNHEQRAGLLRTELYGLVRDERQLRREIGTRVLAGESVDALVVQRTANREAQDTVASAIIVIQARTAA